jgi:hypothetical protein
MGRAACLLEVILAVARYCAGNQRPLLTFATLKRLVAGQNVSVELCH